MAAIVLNSHINVIQIVLSFTFGLYNDSLMSQNYVGVLWHLQGIGLSLHRLPFCFQWPSCVCDFNIIHKIIIIIIIIIYVHLIQKMATARRM